MPVAAQRTTDRYAFDVISSTAPANSTLAAMLATATQEAAGDAFDGIKASPAASWVAVASIAASVLFAGAVLLITSNAYRSVVRWAATGIDVSLYFRPDT